MQLGFEIGDFADICYTFLAYNEFSANIHGQKFILYPFPLCVF